MKLFEFLFNKNHKNNSTVPQNSESSLAAAKATCESELTEHTKKEIMVRRVSIQDMEQFTLLPFTWNSDIKKVTGPRIQPYAFMDITGSNIYAACLALEDLNGLLLDANKYIYPAWRIISIPVDEIDFTPAEGKSYSKIICTPHTFTGRISKYPVSLLFMTAHGIDVDSTHGELFYDKNGTVRKAEVICWRRHRCFCFYYKTIEGQLVLERIDATAPKYENGAYETIYRRK